MTKLGEVNLVRPNDTVHSRGNGIPMRREERNLREKFVNEEAMRMRRRQGVKEFYARCTVRERRKSNLLFLFLFS